MTSPNSPISRVACALLLLLTLLASGCAWSNPDNRPVLGAFQQTLVPEDDTLFWISTPLTVPLGIVAFVVDVFVAHPLQVVDDATRDSAGIWKEIDWRGQYYSQTALCLLRAPLTVLVWVNMLLTRSMIDLPPHTEPVYVEVPPEQAEGVAP